MDEITLVLVFVVLNDLAICGAWWGTRRAVRKAARTSNLIPDLTPRQEEAVKWYVSTELEDLTRRYEKTVAGEPLNQ